MYYLSEDVDQDNMNQGLKKLSANQCYLWYSRTMLCTLLYTPQPLLFVYLVVNAEGKP